MAVAELARYSKRITSGTSGKVLALALPSVGEQVLSMLVGMVNTYMVGHLGSTPLAAVGLGDQIVMLISAFFLAVSTGSTALVARYVGAGDQEQASRVMRQSVFLGAAIGLVGTLAVTPLARQIMIWLGAAEDVIPLGATYLGIASLSYTLMAVMFIGNGALRGAGDTRIPLAVMGIINVTNVAIGYVLLHGVGPFAPMGVQGIAIGATVARSLGAVLVVALLVRGRAGLVLRLKGFRLDWDIIRRVANIGLPTGLEQVFMRLGMVAFATVVASLGTAAYAAHQVSMTSMSVSWMPGFGFGVAATTLVGQRLGAKDPKGAEEACNTAARLAMIFQGTIGLLMFFFGAQVVSIFINEPDVIAQGASCVRLLGLTQPASAAAVTIGGGLRGAGDTRWPMIITTASIWLIRIPLGWVLALTVGMGLLGVWAAMGLEMIGRALLFRWRFRTGKWKTVRV